MGFFDSIKKSLGGGDKTPDTVTGPSAALREAGIDPSGLDFRFGSDGTVTVTGRVMDEERRARIAEVVAAIPQVTGVDNRIEVGVEAPSVPEPPPAPEVTSAPEPETTEAPAAGEPADDPGAETASAEGEAVSSYTVQPGDSLWKIAEAHYGNGTKYQAIFEANRDILDNPDLIKPGQVLKLPPL